MCVGAEWWGPPYVGCPAALPEAEAFDEEAETEVLRVDAPDADADDFELEAEAAPDEVELLEHVALAARPFATKYWLIVA